LQERQLDRAGAHSAYTVASLAAELGVSAKAIRCAIARHELQSVKRGSRWIISADAVGEWASAPEAHDATARRRRAALPPTPKAAGPRCARFSAGKPTRRAVEFGGIRDERREGN
jgi:excisionase family DNA binding protein